MASNAKKIAARVFAAALIVSTPGIKEALAAANMSGRAALRGVPAFVGIAPVQAPTLARSLALPAATALPQIHSAPALGPAISARMLTPEAALAAFANASAPGVSLPVSGQSSSDPSASAAAASAFFDQASVKPAAASTPRPAAGTRLAAAMAPIATVVASEQADSSALWLTLGAAGVASAASYIGFKAKRLVENVKISLDRKPTEAEIAAYKRAEDIQRLERSRQLAGGSMERRSTVDLDKILVDEIRRLSGTDPETASAQSHALIRQFRSQYAAYVHPFIARWVSRGADRSEVVAKTQARQRYNELKRLRRAIVQGQTARNHRDVILRPEDYRNDHSARLIPALNDEMRAIEQKHPEFARMSSWTKAAIVAVIFGAIAVLSLGWAVAALVTAAIVWANYYVVTRSTPEQRKQMGESSRNMSDLR